MKVIEGSQLILGVGANHLLSTTCTTLAKPSKSSHKSELFVEMATHVRCLLLPSIYPCPHAVPLKEPWSGEGSVCYKISLYPNKKPNQCGQEKKGSSCLTKSLASQSCPLLCGLPSHYVQKLQTCMDPTWQPTKKIEDTGWSKRGQVDEQFTSNLLTLHFVRPLRASASTEEGGKIVACLECCWFQNPIIDSRKTDV